MMRRYRHASVENTSITARRVSLAFRSSPAACALTALMIGTGLTGCGSAPRQPEVAVQRPARVTQAPSPPARAPRGGGYYLDDGPGDSPPADLDSIPEPVPQLEALHRGAMRPYVVMGQSFTPMTELAPYKARGVASWYGRRYHGKQTSIGEIYDMYAMSAAHPVLPLPSYVRVTNVTTGKSVIVRVNDRGPFIDNRIIDLSYTAAHRLGILSGGSGVVEVETVIPDASSGNTLFASAPSTAPSAPARPTGAAIPRRSAVVPPAAAQSPGTREEADPILAIAIAAAARENQSIAKEPPQATQMTSHTAPVRADMVESSAIYLQLGAFASRENAESYLARAKAEVDWLAQALHLAPSDGVYRVHAGPYASAVEARQAAERVALALGVKPLLITR
jgi:rare lipoprotein A